MGVSVWQLLILCPLIFLSGFVDSIAGGGGLISLPAYMIIGLPPHVARGTNKLSALMGTATATTRYALKGFIPWKEAGVCVVTALAGSYLGTELGLLVDEDIFKIIMLVIIPLTAIYVWFKKNEAKEKDPYGFARTLIISAIIAFVIGVYDGFYGPGTGTFLILLLTVLAHISMDRAQGMSKAINLSTNVASFVVFLMNDKVMILLGLFAGVFSMLGSFVGTKLYFKNTIKIVRPIMIFVLVIFFLKVLLEVLGVSPF